MRKMKSNNGTVINVTEHLILSNLWEYYVTDDDTGDKDVKACLVMGFETELGDVYMPEISPYVKSRTKDLNIMPAEGWKWVD